jgi:hypothetical protein
MSETFQCGDNAALVGYLYDECAPDERRIIDAHLAVCAVCTAEVAALRSTRLSLSSWAPPDADLNFKIVAEAAPAKVLRPRSWWTQPMPAWGQAAAAIVLFGAGLAMGVTQGTAPAPAAQTTVASAPSAAAPSTAPGAGAGTVSAADLAAVERRLRAEMAQLRTAAAASAAPASLQAQAPALSGVEGQVLARVRELIEESEQRQQRELALRVTQVMRDVDTQRRMDLAQIQGNFRQIEGVTGAQVREQRDIMNYLIRASQQGR